MTYLWIYLFSFALLDFGGVPKLFILKSDGLRAISLVRQMTYLSVNAELSQSMIERDGDEGEDDDNEGVLDTDLRAYLEEIEEILEIDETSTVSANVPVLPDPLEKVLESMTAAAEEKESLEGVDCPATAEVYSIDFLEDIAKALENDEHDITDVFHDSLLNKAFLFAVMFVVGRSFMHSIRLNFKSNTPWKVSLLIIFTPLFIYGIFLYLLSQSIAETSSVALLLGIISLFNASSSDTPVAKGLKLIVNASQGVYSCEVLFDDVNVSVLEVRERIAEELNITPSIRVCIESGRGNYIEKLNVPILPMLSNTFASPDFIGALTASLKITVTDVIECKDEVQQKEEMSPSSIFDIMNSAESVKYAADLQMTARVRSTAFDLVSFSISTCNGFAAASPHHQFPIPNAGSTLRFVHFSIPAGVSSSSLLDGGKATQSALTPTKNMSKTLVKDKDTVYLECDGKYLSVAKGWWLAWSSDVPRRSGAFTIEITERARKNVALKSLKSGMKKIKETIMDPTLLGGKKDEAVVDKAESVLRAGDSFRLRNVKFPEYELGVTSVKISTTRDNLCYLGLRKAEDSSNSSGNEWAIGVRFTVKPAGMLTTAALGITAAAEGVTNIGEGLSHMSSSRRFDVRNSSREI